MENKKTVTHLWPNKLGKPTTPLGLMDNVHIRSAHRLCWYRLYLDTEYKGGYTDEQVQAWGIFITRDQANKWIPLFKEEVKKRKMILHKPDILGYKKWLQERRNKKHYSQENFKKITSYDQRTNSFDTP